MVWGVVRVWVWVGATVTTSLLIDFTRIVGSAVGSGREAAGNAVGPKMEPGPSSAAETTAGSDPAVSVFVRVRPLTPAEGLQPLPGMSSAPADEGAAVALAPGIGGFTGLLGQELNTAAVFERCLAQRIGTVLGGGAVSLFCYGCTDP